MEWRTEYAADIEDLARVLNRVAGPPGNDHTGPYWKVYQIIVSVAGDFAVVFYQDGLD